MAQYIPHPALSGIDAGNQFALQQMQMVERAQDLAARNLMNEQSKRNDWMNQIYRDRDVIRTLHIDPKTGNPLTPENADKLAGTYGQDIMNSIAQAYVRDQNRIFGMDPNMPEAVANPRQTMSNIMPGAQLPPMPAGWATKYSRAQLDQYGNPIMEKRTYSGIPLRPGQSTTYFAPKTTEYYPPEFFAKPFQYQE